MALKHVFTPLQIGPVSVKNRIVRAAHATGRVSRGMGDDFIAYHEERAKGGCGLTIIEGGAVHQSTIQPMRLVRDDIKSDYEKLMAAVRPHDMRVFQQLWHGGSIYSPAEPPLAVSTMISNTGIVGQACSESEIWDIIAGFAHCARDARDGGLDGVEIHAGHGYFLSQFISPLFNTREDEWGGGIQGRMRILLEILRAVRKNVGRDIAVGIRLSAADAPGDISEEDNRTILQALQDEKLIDYANISKGTYYRVATQVGCMEEPAGYELPSARKTLEGVTVARLVTGRFRTVEEADQTIRDGDADLVSMVRAQIADPFLVQKSQAGKIEQVRPCIACNQGCLGNLIRTGGLVGGTVDCLVNPTSGYETYLAEDLIRPASRPLGVLVVGGGPAGMEAARAAALQGHKVKLVEASPHLGGMVNVAVRAPYLSTIGDITFWLEQEVYRLGVEVVLNTFMDASDVESEAADIIIVATGSMPRMDGVQFTNPGEPAKGVAQRHVISSIDLLTDPLRELGKSAVVLDTVGHFEAIGSCEYLLGRGVEVTLVTPLTSSFPFAQSTFRDVSSLERFYRMGGFTALVRHHLVEITQRGCIVRPSQADASHDVTLQADTVVLVTQNQPLRDVYDQLRGKHPRIFVIGDAKSPRDIQASIAEGHRVARALAN